MNENLQILFNRRSIRAYEEREIGPDARDAVLQATLRVRTPVSRSPSQVRRRGRV